MPKTLRGPTSPVTAVFRAIANAIRTDPVVFAIVGGNFLTWEGGALDQNPPTATAGRPFVRLTPRPLSEKWWLTGWKVVMLGIDIEMAISGFSSDDMTDLWQAIMAAIEPADGGAFMATLRAAGAQTGQVLHATPAVDRTRDTGTSRLNPKPESQWDARGQIQIAVVVGAGTLPVFAEPHPEPAGAIAAGGGDVTAGGDPIVTADATALPAGTSSTLGAP